MLGLGSGPARGEPGRGVRLASELREEVVVVGQMLVEEDGAGSHLRGWKIAEQRSDDGALREPRRAGTCA